MLIGKDKNDIYTDKEEELHLSLIYRNTQPDTAYSERKLYYDNAQKVLNISAPHTMYEYELNEITNKVIKFLKQMLRLLEL